MITIRQPTLDDKDEFIVAMKQSADYHHPWVKAPATSLEYDDYLERYKGDNQQTYLVLSGAKIAGVINLNEMVRGCFQSAFVGFYAVYGCSGRGVMQEGLRLVLDKAFHELGLHRIEANIQPENIRSINLVERCGFRYEGFAPRYLKIDNVWRGHEHWAMTVEDFIRDKEEVIKKDSVAIHSYDPAWQQMAVDEIDLIRKILPEKFILGIQHVGSTSVPNMPAKPIVDIQIATESLEIAKYVAVPLLQKCGYEFWSDNPDPNRLFFVKGMPPFGEQRTHHVHIVEKDSSHWHDKLAFRDCLRENAELAGEYAALKMQLAQQYEFDREKYTQAKTDFIKHALATCSQLDNG